MSATVEFYLARAEESALAARQTDLENVRERCLRSEAVWRAMAVRLADVEKMKERNAQDKIQRGLVG